MGGPDLFVHLGVNATRAHAAAWGDTQYAEGLARAIRALPGCDCDLLFRGEAPDPARPGAVILRIVGPHLEEPVPGLPNLLWMISPPILAPLTMLGRYQAIFCAARRLARNLAGHDLPVRFLPQATEVDHFHPARRRADQPEIPLAFVGAYAARANRRVVLHAVEAGFEPQIWGPGWKGVVPGRLWQGERLDYAPLAELYARTRVVLNSHMPNMARMGFMSNRSYDALASGALVVSDAVAGFDDPDLPELRQVGDQAALVAVLGSLLAAPPLDPSERLALHDRVADRHSFAVRAAVIVDVARHLLAEGRRATPAFVPGRTMRPTRPTLRDPAMSAETGADGLRAAADQILEISAWLEGGDTAALAPPAPVDREGVIHPLMADLREIQQIACAADVATGGAGSALAPKGDIGAGNAKAGDAGRGESRTGEAGTEAAGAIGAGATGARANAAGASDLRANNARASNSQASNSQASDSQASDSQASDSQASDTQVSSPRAGSPGANDRPNADQPPRDTRARDARLEPIVGRARRLAEILAAPSSAPLGASIPPSQLEQALVRIMHNEPLWPHGPEGFNRDGGKVSLQLWPRKDPPPASDLPGVFLHLYYDDLAPVFARRLEHLGDCRLYVSTDTEAKADRIRHSLPGAEIRVMQNRGRDIWPKLYGFADAHDRHEIVLHLHGKKSPHADRLDDWLTHILDCLVGSTGEVNRIRSFFATMPRLGMVTPITFRSVLGAAHWAANRDIARELAARMGLDGPLPGHAGLRFPVGSMFWARTAAIRPLLDLRLTAGHFPPEAGQVDGTLAHAIERMLGVTCRATGHHILPVSGADSRLHARHRKQFRTNHALRDALDNGAFDA